MKSFAVVIIGFTCVVPAVAQEAGVDKYQATIDKGLAWLVKQQAKDGNWSEGGHMPMAMTAYAGMTLSADGNTLTKGKYAPQLRAAVGWYLTQKSADVKYQGVLGDVANPGNMGRYMVQHGVALSFLTQVYSEAEGDDRVALRELLRDAVDFSVKGQTSFGGWFYTSTIEGHDTAENVATVLQLHGLIDARNAGIPVPKKSLDKSLAYLHRCTTPRGGIAYSGGANSSAPTGGERPSITAMALAAFLPHDGPKFKTSRQWLAYWADHKLFGIERLDAPVDTLIHFYLARAVFHLKEDDWRAAFPDKELPDHLTWTKYRKRLFDRLQRDQQKDGSWTRTWTLGPVFTSSTALNILLYEKSLPIRR